MKEYKTPFITLLEMNLEGSTMLTQSGYDSKYGTELIDWDESIDF